MVAAPPTSLISRLREARDRGADYLIDQQRDDGVIGTPEKDGLGPYYKTLWALTCAGRTAEANRLATWIAHEVLTEEGDFAGDMRGKFFDRSYAYPNAWMIIGAHKLGRYDISRRGMEFLMLLHHETGGFRIERDNEDAVQDILNTCQAGNACLTTGHLADAKSVGRFLRTVYEAQPDPEHVLYFVYKPGQGLRTSYPDERQKIHSIRDDTPRQAYFNMGIAAAFLARLSMTTGDGSWSVLGRDYLALAFNVLDEMYETAQVGKVGWGAALVYQTSGDQKMKMLAERVGEAMLAQQTDTGGWDNTGGYVNDAIRTEVTAEFVVLIDEMLAGLSAR
jgi:hypothetical protein